MSVRAGPDETSVTLPTRFISANETYSVSIVAETALPSSKVGPVNITIREFVMLENFSSRISVSQVNFSREWATRCPNLVPMLVRL